MIHIIYNIKKYYMDMYNIIYASVKRDLFKGIVLHDCERAGKSEVVEKASRKSVRI